MSFESNKRVKRKPKEGGWLRVTAAILGGLIVATILGILMSIYLPMPTNNRIALSGILIIPIWVLVAFPCLLSKSGWRAWTYCLLVVVVSIYPLWLGLK